jgi:hypothetical protein
MRSAVVAVGLVIIVVVGLAVGYFAGSTQRVTTTLTVPSRVTTTLTVPSDEFELTFRQTALCPNLGFIAPWKVVLSNRESMTAPPDVNFSTNMAYGSSPTFPSMITFYVPNGNYTFSVTPSSLLTPATGNVTVDNQEVVVTLGQMLFSCGSTTAG